MPPANNAATAEPAVATIVLASDRLNLSDVIDAADDARADVAATRLDRYNAAVAEGKQIVAKIEAAEGGQLRLGELADGVETDYGHNRLGKFARDLLGIATCTVKRHRDVWRRWKSAPGRVLEFARSHYAVARELQTLEDKFDIIERQPDLTKRQARSIVRQRRRDEAEANPSGVRRNENKKWFDTIFDLTNKVAGLVERADQPNAADAEILREIVDPKLVPDIREAGNSLIRIADYLDGLFVRGEA